MPILIGIDWQWALIKVVLLFASGETTGQYLFSATLSEDQRYDGTPIVFDRVVTNRGGMYSDLSGVFIAPGMHTLNTRSCI